MVTESYPPEVNGVANSVARVVDGLRARDHAVQLVRPRQAHEARTNGRGVIDEIRTAGMQIPRYGQLRMGLPAGHQLTRAWTTRRPDIVHIATEGPLGWSALKVARAMGLPVCADFRTNFHAYSRFYRLGWLQGPIVGYLRSFHNRCHCTMVPTEALQEELAESGFRSLHVVARGVDTRLFTPARRNMALRQQWGAADDGLVVLHVGRLAPEKNLAIVMQAFDSIRQIKPDARLVLVGDGPSRAEWQARRPDVVFAGFRTGEDLATHYASSDLFLFPSLTETYGNVTPEAMASGLAMVAYDDAAAGQLIQHGIDGLLARKGDVADFLVCATDIAANRHWRQAMGVAARARVADLGWDSILGRVERIYAATIRSARAPVLWSGSGATAEAGGPTSEGVPSHPQGHGASAS
jgi:glycosyltransferase involved in cell wall biosynthesis